MFKDVTLIQNFLLGMVLPLVIAVINQAKWPRTIKGLCALIMCILAAVIVEVIRGDLSFVDWGATVVVIFTTAFGFYSVLWKPSEIAPRLENATSLDQSAPRPV